MSNKLPLLLDECVQEHLAQEIKEYGGFSSFERIHGTHELCSKLDTEVMAYAKTHGKILVTVETRINENNFPICTHPGIITIHARGGHEFSAGKLFRKFMGSGERKHAKHGVTYLKASGSIIRVRNIKDGSMMDIPLNL